MLEAEFKSRKKTFWLSNDIYRKVFFIETESTEKGFPDVLCVDAVQTAFLYEFKVTRGEDNVIEFERNQPLWYKLHAKYLNVYIIAYDNVTRLQHCFPALALFDKTGPYYLPLGSLKLKLPKSRTNYTKETID